MDKEYNDRNDGTNVNKVTLEYLMNPQHYGKYVNDKTDENKQNREEDKKFYKKRIISLTKEMLKNKFPNDELKKRLEDYLDSLIEYFKMIDKKDIIQADYNDMDKELEEQKYNGFPVQNNIQEGNELIYNNKIEKTITMDNFVTKKTIKKNEKHILPVKKDINLKNPELRKKGIKKKKKNIDNV